MGAAGPETDKRDLSTLPRGMYICKKRYDAYLMIFEDNQGIIFLISS